MKNEKRKALVTGGAGFLGPHLIRRLLESGWSVASVDDFSTGRRSHLEPFRANTAFVSYEGDIRDGRFVEEAMSSFRPEVVFHLAAVHFIPRCIANPTETLEINVMGTQRLLDSLERAPAARFVLASTADVYAPGDLPHSETSPLGSPNIYGSSKEMCERLSALARRRFPSIRFLTTRFFNIYGPGETNPHVLPDILACLRKGRLLRLGNIEPKRDYVYVADVAEALEKLADYDGLFDTFNIATGESRSVRELVLSLEKVLGERITIETDPAKVRPSERQNLHADSALARRELRWQPRMPLEQGLAETIRIELERSAGLRG